MHSYLILQLFTIFLYDLLIESHVQKSPKASAKFAKQASVPPDNAVYSRCVRVHGAAIDV